MPLRPGAKPPGAKPPEETPIQSVEGGLESLDNFPGRIRSDWQMRPGQTLSSAVPLRPDPYLALEDEIQRRGIGEGFGPDEQARMSKAEYDYNQELLQKRAASAGYHRRLNAENALKELAGHKDAIKNPEVWARIAGVDLVNGHPAVLEQAGQEIAKDRPDRKKVISLLRQMSPYEARFVAMAIVAAGKGDLIRARTD
jgi:hypothetical protein